MTALAAAPAELRELAEAVGLEPLLPLLKELDAELAQFVAAPPPGPEALAAKAHGLVGAAGGVGFADLAEACRALEHACKARRDPAIELAAAQLHANDARGVIAALAAG